MTKTTLLPAALCLLLPLAAQAQPTRDADTGISGEIRRELADARKEMRVEMAKAKQDLRREVAAEKFVLAGHSHTLSHAACGRQDAGPIDRRHSHIFRVFG